MTDHADAKAVAESNVVTADEVLALPWNGPGDRPPASAGARQLDILARQLLSIQSQLDVAFAIVAGLQEREQLRTAAPTLETAPDERRPPPTFGAKRREHQQGQQGQHGTVPPTTTPTGGEHGKQ